MPRRIRIVVSVFFALLAVAFAGLWVRSYRYGDYAVTPISSTTAMSVSSSLGGIRISVIVPAALGVAMPERDYYDVPLTPTARAMIVAKPSFGYTTDKLARRMVLPHWLLSTVAGFVAAAIGWSAWFPSNIKFSLRTLLIATTLVAVLLGLLVWAGR